MAKNAIQDYQVSSSMCAVSLNEYLNALGIFGSFSKELSTSETFTQIQYLRRLFPSYSVCDSCKMWTYQHSEGTIFHRTPNGQVSQKLSSVYIYPNCTQGCERELTLISIADHVISAYQKIFGKSARSHSML